MSDRLTTALLGMRVALGCTDVGHAPAMDQRLVAGDAGVVRPCGVRAPAEPRRDR